MQGWGRAVNWSKSRLPKLQLVKIILATMLQARETTHQTDDKVPQPRYWHLLMDGISLRRLIKCKCNE